MKRYLRILVLLLAVWMLVLPVQAAGTNSITIAHTREGQPISGAEFRLYRMAKDYEDAQDAYAAVLQAGQQPMAVQITDGQGSAVFAALEDGTYLLTAVPHKIGDKICEVEMSLLTLPGQDENGAPTADITVQTKYEMKDDVSRIEYRVIVLWEDAPAATLALAAAEGAAWNHPDSVEVYLYRNDILTDTVEPGRDNNWQHLWTETDPTAVWAVVEDVPEGYTVRYSRDGNTFIILNTPEEDIPAESTTPTDSSKPTDPTKPTGPKLPQTGQLWWPVPFLALSGCALFLLGWILRKESRDEA